MKQSRENLSFVGRLEGERAVSLKALVSFTFPSSHFTIGQLFNSKAVQREDLSEVKFNKFLECLINVGQYACIPCINLMQVAGCCLKLIHQNELTSTFYFLKSFRRSHSSNIWLDSQQKSYTIFHDDCLIS